MEGTQTSLLVDIYQYLERNKKLGSEREELRRKEMERQNTTSDFTTVDHDTKLETADGKPVDEKTVHEITRENDLINESCESDNDVDGRNSRFIVSPVYDAKLFAEKNNEENLQDFHEGFGDNSLTTSMTKSTEINNVLDKADDNQGTLHFFKV